MKYRIVPISDAYIKSFHAALDVVARERKYLALVEAPALRATRKFVRDNVRAKGVHLVALESGQVVGWCDIARFPRETMNHSGVLGLGVLPQYRGNGIGRALMTGAISRAWKRSFSRIELTVRNDNVAAINLYKHLGFEAEGIRRGALRIDAEYVDLLAMALRRGS